MSSLVAEWSADQKAAFGKTPIMFRHGLAETGLFDDEPLARLLDAYPAELYDINLFDFDDEGQASMRTGARGRLPGARCWKGSSKGRSGCSCAGPRPGIPNWAR